MPNLRKGVIKKKSVRELIYLVLVLEKKSRVGDLRFRLPEPIQSYTGNHFATSFGPACAQQNVSLPDFPPQVPQDAIDTLMHVIRVSPESEDCGFFQIDLPLLVLVTATRELT